MREGATVDVMEEVKAAGGSVLVHTVAEGSAAVDSEVGSAAADSEAADSEAETEEATVVDLGEAPVVAGKGGSSAPTQ